MDGLRSILIFLLTISLVFSIGLIFFLSYGYGIETEKAPCVDGDGDVNLEGIMCDKEYATFFGEKTTDNYHVGILAIFLFLAFLIITEIYFLIPKEERRMFN